jgi:transcriptional regulator with XRE-family HTH domain
MTGPPQIVDALKRLVKSRGLTYAQLAKRVALSEASVKRLFSRGSFTLARLAQFCDVLDVDLFELARLARGRAGETHEMTLAQESALAADARLLAVFYLVFSGWTHGDIVASFEITAAQCTALMLKLDRLRLIELLPGNRVRVKATPATRLRADGPIRRLHGKRVVDDFLAPQFDRAGGHFAFEFRDLSRASVEVMRRKLERLAAEFHELAELDSHLRASARETIGLAVGLRPWTIAGALGLARRRASGGAVDRRAAAARG